MTGGKSESLQSAADKPQGGAGMWEALPEVGGFLNLVLSLLFKRENPFSSVIPTRLPSPSLWRRTRRGIEKS